MDELQAKEFRKACDETVVLLLVDDQPMVIEAVRRQLAEMHDIEFHSCADSATALAMAESIEPTVILQDLVMPGLDGLSLIGAYRKNKITGGIPIIALSVKEDAKVKSQAFEAGADDYLVKLPDPIELIARIRYHSRSFVTTRQLDHTYNLLRASQQQLLDTNLVLQRANSALRRLINSDGLTDLPNRRHFDEFLQAEWRQAVETGSEISMLMIDVDFFKLFNDEYGHLAGDDALKKVAAAMRETITDESYLPARYGGEEFAVVLPGMSRSDAELVGNILREKVEEIGIPHHAPVPGAVVTVSIGLATLKPSEASGSIKLIELADKALYLAKRRGRNRVVIHMEGE
ncbi:diguanylate cyclase domain-containing protein [Pseudomonas siliginis]|uniref:diguanylate cyclase domain-containing protein n=1 Tax=Pseudomonas siliginis TaxID=2842346 RepID=UPI00386E933F